MQVSTTDGLPPSICSTCVYKCVTWFSFKQQCEHIDSILRNQLNFKSFTKTECKTAETGVQVVDVSVFSEQAVKEKNQIYDIVELEEIEVVKAEQNNFNESNEPAFNDNKEV